jgi:hypothetical protein
MLIYLRFLFISDFPYNILHANALSRNQCGIHALPITAILIGAPEQYLRVGVANAYGLNGQRIGFRFSEGA